MGLAKIAAVDWWAKSKTALGIRTALLYCEARFSYNAHACRRTRDLVRVNRHGEANAWATCVARLAGEYFTPRFWSSSYRLR